MSINRIFIVVILISFCGLYSCKKKSGAAPVFDFSYSGNLIVGDTVFFSSNAPALSKYLWSFGDGTTSTVASPRHIYIFPVNAMVTLVLNGDSANEVKKAITIGLDSGYAAQVCGTRQWLYTDIFYNDNYVSGNGFDTFAYNQRLTANIQFVGKNAVMFVTDSMPYLDIMNYDSSRSNSTELFFTGKTQFYRDMASSTTLQYNAATKSIIVTNHLPYGVSDYYNKTFVSQ